MFALLVAAWPAAVAYAAEPSPGLTPTPLPKVEHQTVGTGPRFLTPMEERKVAAAALAPAPRVEAARSAESTSRIAPWAPRFAALKDPGFSTFIPLPDFAARAFVEKPFVEAPSTAVERKAGPTR
jgi:hypothetical protein